MENKTVNETLNAIVQKHLSLFEAKFNDKNIESLEKVKIFTELKNLKFKKYLELTKYVEKYEIFIGFCLKIRHVIWKITTILML